MNCFEIRSLLSQKYWEKYDSTMNHKAIRKKHFFNLEKRWGFKIFILGLLLAAQIMNLFWHNANFQGFLYLNICLPVMFSQYKYLLSLKFEKICFQCKAFVSPTQNESPLKLLFVLRAWKGPRNVRGWKIGLRSG